MLVEITGFWNDWVKFLKTYKTTKFVARFSLNTYTWQIVVVMALYWFLRKVRSGHFVFMRWSSLGKPTYSRLCGRHFFSVKLWSNLQLRNVWPLKLLQKCVVVRRGNERILRYFFFLCIFSNVIKFESEIPRYKTPKCCLKTELCAKRPNLETFTTLFASR